MNITFVTYRNSIEVVDGGALRGGTLQEGAEVETFDGKLHQSVDLVS